MRSKPNLSLGVPELRKPTTLGPLAFLSLDVHGNLAASEDAVDSVLHRRHVRRFCIRTVSSPLQSLSDRAAW
jgi:hypothetical protein